MGSPIRMFLVAAMQRRGCACWRREPPCHLVLAPSSADPPSVLPSRRNAILQFRRGLGDLHTPGMVYRAGIVPKAHLILVGARGF